MIAELQSFGLFRGVEPEQLERIATGFKTATARKGDRVFAAGDPAPCVYLVRSGEVELRFEVSCYNSSAEITLSRRAKGDVFGWSAVIPPHKYTLSAHVTEDSEFFTIAKEDIDRACESDAGFGYVFMRNTAEIIGLRYERARGILLKEIQRGLEEQFRNA